MATEIYKGRLNLCSVKQYHDKSLGEISLVLELTERFKSINKLKLVTSMHDLH